MGDFNYDVVNVVGHRPWPMPARPWSFTQTWTDLLFAHWPVAASAMRPHIPRAFELDLFDGSAWISVVPFCMSNVSLRSVPALPWLSAFAELNVRTYVHVDNKPGVFFFSLDAERLPAVVAARALLNLPYHFAKMQIRREGETITYTNRRVADSSIALAATYAPDGPACAPAPGSRDHFLTERYCLYAARRNGSPYRLEIHHPPWALQPARAHFEQNTMTSRHGIALTGAPVVHFSKRQDVIAWTPDRLS